jgi:hypothetical protein
MKIGQSPNKEAGSDTNKRHFRLTNDPKKPSEALKNPLYSPSAAPAWVKIQHAFRPRLHQDKPGCQACG